MAVALHMFSPGQTMNWFLYLQLKIAIIYKLTPPPIFMTVDRKLNLT